jgi:hypothetical protein
MTHATVAAGSAILAALALHGVIFALLRLGRRNQHHTEAEVAAAFTSRCAGPLWPWAWRSRPADRMVSHVWLRWTGFVVPASPAG